MGNQRQFHIKYKPIELYFIPRALGNIKNANIIIVILFKKDNINRFNQAVSIAIDLIDQNKIYSLHLQMYQQWECKFTQIIIKSMSDFSILQQQQHKFAHQLQQILFKILNSRNAKMSTQNNNKIEPQVIHIKDFVEQKNLQNSQKQCESKCQKQSGKYEDKLNCRKQQNAKTQSNDLLNFDVEPIRVQPKIQSRASQQEFMKQMYNEKKEVHCEVERKQELTPKQADKISKQVKQDEKKQKEAQKLASSKKINKDVKQKKKEKIIKNKKDNNNKTEHLQSESMEHEVEKQNQVQMN